MTTLVFGLQFSVLVHTLLLALVKIILLLVSIAYYTLSERKVMASVQRRRGPNIVGVWGLLQPLSDGLKLFAKEMVIPSKANVNIFILSPLLILTFSLITWSLIPFYFHEGAYQLMPFIVFQNFVTADVIGDISIKDLLLLLSEWSSIADINSGVLAILAISSICVYLLILGGWASNSKYSFLGALRSAAQMISYEVAISLVMLPVIFLAGSLNLAEIVLRQAETVWFCFPLLPKMITFFISILAETNRAPFDLPEAEAELVSGYNTEYASITFAMFFLAEYANMILMSALMALFFLGGWLLPKLFSILFIAPSVIFAYKTIIFCYSFIWVRATFPRYRYDQLMWIGWKIFLPISLAFLIYITGIFMIFDACPFVYEITPGSFTGTVLFCSGDPILFQWNRAQVYARLKRSPGPKDDPAFALWVSQMSDLERAEIYAQIERPPEPNDSAEFVELVEKLTDLKRSGKFRSSFDFNIDNDNSFIKIINNNKLSKKSKNIVTEKGLTLYSPQSNTSGDSTDKTTMFDYDPKAADAEDLFKKDFYNHKYEHEDEVQDLDKSVIDIIRNKRKYEKDPNFIVYFFFLGILLNIPNIAIISFYLIRLYNPSIFPFVFKHLEIAMPGVVILLCSLSGIFIFVTRYYAIRNIPEIPLIWAPYWDIDNIHLLNKVPEMLNNPSFVQKWRIFAKISTYYIIVVYWIFFLLVFLLLAYCCVIDTIFFCIFFTFILSIIQNRSLFNWERWKIIYVSTAILGICSWIFLVINLFLFLKGYSSFEFKLNNSVIILKTAFCTIEYVPSVVEIEKAIRCILEQNIHSKDLMHSSTISDFINARVNNYLNGKETLQQIHTESHKFVWQLRDQSIMNLAKAELREEYKELAGAVGLTCFCSSGLIYLLFF